jgi:hypothetical protein
MGNTQSLEQEYDGLYSFDNINLRNNNKEIHNMMRQLGYNYFNINKLKIDFKNIYLHIIIGYLNRDKMSDAYVDYYNEFLSYLDNVIIEKDIRKYSICDLYTIIEESSDYKDYLESLNHSFRRSAQLSKFLYDDDTQAFYEHLDEIELEIIREYKMN